jgi:predicted dehydrogenase
VKIESITNIKIIGGGRWARVILEVLCRIVDKSVKIYVYSKNNSIGMSDWISSKKIGDNIQVFKDLPNKFSTDTNAVIVVNAARDHEKFILSALKAGGHVLVEKPITLSYDTGNKIAIIAKDLNKHLTSAHVFLFANYFINFTKLVLNADKISKININWEDPGVEDRYGEKKLYDTGLPVFSDWIPHVLSMISAIASGKDFIFLSIELERGGASVTVHILAGDIPCEIILTRNGKSRKRYMDVYTETKILKLDFSKEPGTIYDGTNVIDGDTEWESNKSPLESMLSAFLKQISENVLDDRLNLEIGLKALKVIDSAMIDYRKKQIIWLIENISLQTSKLGEVALTEDLIYALSEIFQSNIFIPKEELINKVKRFLFKLNDPSDKNWLVQFKKANINDAIIQLEKI